MNRPMTVREKQQAREDYLADPSVSVQQLADEYGVSRSAMLRALQGVTRAPGGTVKSRLSVDEMRRLRDGGFTLSYISQQAGITESGVWRRLYGSNNRNREVV